MVEKEKKVEKVDAEVVNGKSPTAAKTEELIDSAKDVYSQLTVRGRTHFPCGSMFIVLPIVPYPPQY